MEPTKEHLNAGPHGFQTWILFARLLHGIRGTAESSNQAVLWKAAPTGSTYERKYDVMHASGWWKAIANAYSVAAILA